MSAFTSWLIRPVATDRPDKDGWARQKTYDYQTSPNEKRDVGAITKFAGGAWTVVIVDMSQPVAEKRGAQVKLVFDRLLPKGYARESFAGKTAHRLDEPRIAELKRFVEEGRKDLRVPGVALALLQNGKAIYSGFGVRDIETGKPVEPDTLFMIASRRSWRRSTGSWSPAVTWAWSTRSNRCRWCRSAPSGWPGRRPSP